MSGSKLMQADVNRLLEELEAVNIQVVSPVEHGVEQYRQIHEYWIKAPQPRKYVVVVLHPEVCGCDAITDELVLHG